MSQPPVVIHIGLHKTATRYLQRAVFRQLDSSRFWVNPNPLYHDLRQAARNPGDEDWAAAAETAAEEARQHAGGRTLVLSDPSISGDMYSAHADYRENLDLVHRIFPEARIIYFVRRQSSWLQSAWRQSLVKERGQSIEAFLNFYDGDFQPRIARRVFGGRNLEALSLRFLEIYQAYAETYGPERVYLFRQEDLRRQPAVVYMRLAEALGLNSLPPMPSRVSSNRAFSGLAIRLFIPPTRRVPSRPNADDPHVGVEPAEGRVRRHARRLRSLMIRHVFDRLIYRDWDYLERHGMRDRIDEFYADELKRTAAAAERVLEEGPGLAALRASRRDGAAPCARTESF